MLQLLLLASVVYAKFYCSYDKSPRYVHTADETEPETKTICFGFDETADAYVIDVEASITAGLDPQQYKSVYIDPVDGPIIVKLPTITENYFDIWPDNSQDLIGVNTSITFEVPAANTATGVKVYAGENVQKINVPITLKFLPSPEGTVTSSFFVSNSYDAENNLRTADQHSEWIINYEVEDETSFKFETIRTTTIGYNANDNSDFTITEMHFSKKMVFATETRTNIIRNQYENKRPILFKEEYEDQGTKFKLYVKTDLSDFSVYIITTDDGTKVESSSSSGNTDKNTTDSSSSNGNNNDDDDNSSTTMALIMMLSAIFFFMI